MCVIVVIWAEWADVGLWVAVCFLAKISLQRPTCKTTFASLTQSQAISQSFRVFISFSSIRDTTFFHFSKLFFIQNYRFLYHGDQKISWWTLRYRWRAVNFEIHLWSSGRNADCIWRSFSIQHVQIEAGLNSDPGNDSFWDKIREVEHVDRSTHYRLFSRNALPVVTRDAICNWMATQDRSGPRTVQFRIGRTRKRLLLFFSFFSF